MTSDTFKHIEDKTGAAFILQGELAGEIARMVKRDKADVERAVYLACVATGNAPVGVVHCVYEFFAALGDVEKESV